MYKFSFLEYPKATVRDIEKIRDFLALCYIVHSYETAAVNFANSNAKDFVSPFITNEYIKLLAIYSNTNILSQFRENSPFAKTIRKYNKIKNKAEKLDAKSRFIKELNDIIESLNNNLCDFWLLEDFDGIRAVINAMLISNSIEKYLYSQSTIVLQHTGAERNRSGHDHSNFSLASMPDEILFLIENNISFADKYLFSLTNKKYYNLFYTDPLLRVYQKFKDITGFSALPDSVLLVPLLLEFPIIPDLYRLEMMLMLDRVLPKANSFGSIIDKQYKLRMLLNKITHTIEQSPSLLATYREKWITLFEENNPKRNTFGVYSYEICTGKFLNYFDTHYQVADCLTSTFIHVYYLSFNLLWLFLFTLALYSYIDSPAQDVLQYYQTDQSSDLTCYTPNALVSQCVTLTQWQTINNALKTFIENVRFNTNIFCFTSAGASAVLLHLLKNTFSSICSGKFAEPVFKDNIVAQAKNHLRKNIPFYVNSIFGLAGFSVQYFSNSYHFHLSSSIDPASWQQPYTNGNATGIMIDNSAYDAEYFDKVCLDPFINFPMLFLMLFNVYYIYRILEFTLINSVRLGGCVWNNATSSEETSIKSKVLGFSQQTIAGLGTLVSNAGLFAEKTYACCTFRTSAPRAIDLEAGLLTESVRAYSR